MSQTECGLCAATMLMEFYGVAVNIHDITTRFVVGRDGASIADLRQIFNYYQFETNLYEVEGGLYSLTNLALPCIAYHKRGHFIVIETAEENSVTILDPAIGRLKMTKDDLVNNYKNIIVKISPRNVFKKINTRRNEFSLLKEAIYKNKLLVFRAAIVSIIVYAIMMTVPILLKIIVDNYLKFRKLNNSVTTISVVILVSSLAYFFINWLKLTAGVKLSIEIDKFLTYKVINKLFKNKFEYFLNRSSSDIQYRLVLLKNLKTVISDVIIQALLDIGSMIAIFIYILQVQIPYAILLVFATIFVLGTSFTVRGRMLMYKNQEVSNDSKLQMLQYDTFRSIFDVKVLGLSKLKHQVWNEYYKEYIISHKKNQVFSSFYKNILDYTTLYIPIFIPILGIWISGLAGNHEIGTIISLQSLTGVYVTGLVSVSHLAENVTSAKSYIIRIEDILTQDDEEVRDGEVTLRGNIEVKHLSFTYPGEKKEVLSDVNFSVKEDESVAIVGESGSGKSTLFYILLGAYDDYTGMITYERKELDTLNKDKLRQQIGVVPQDSLFFNTTIKENLTQDATVSEEVIYDVLRKVSMYDFVQSLPMKLNTVISENGFNFSGGQKQRLALARAIIGKKTMLFLDEATSSLDNLTEKRVVDYLSEVSQTKIVIAHRLGTIKNSDKIIVLKNGKVAEIGNHQQLMAKKGEYYNMYFKDERG